MSGPNTWDAVYNENYVVRYNLMRFEIKGTKPQHSTGVRLINNKLT